MIHMKPARKMKPRVRKPKGSKRCQYRTFPYLKVAKMWEKGMTIGRIARATKRVDKENANGDLYHSLRNFLYRMHTHGYRDANGRLVRLPYRVSPKNGSCCPQGWIAGL